MARNGELRVLRILSNLGLDCLFDVGAHTGAWTRMAAQMNPTAAIHAFEPVPTTYDALLTNTGSLPNVICNNCGLSSANETVDIRYGRDSSRATGSDVEWMNVPDGYFSHMVNCKTVKAVEYIRERQIEDIDFVKIDVEGMDLRVIKGFEEEIANVRALQFEYGRFSIGSHDLLADFCKHLNRRGFVVGKIFPHCVKFFDYGWRMENLHGSNYLAVKSTEHVLIDKLAKRD